MTGTLCLPPTYAKLIRPQGSSFCRCAMVPFTTWQRQPSSPKNLLHHVPSAAHARTPFPIFFSTALALLVLLLLLQQPTPFFPNVISFSTTFARRLLRCHHLPPQLHALYSTSLFTLNSRQPTGPCTRLRLNCAPVVRPLPPRPSWAFFPQLSYNTSPRPHKHPQRPSPMLSSSFLQSLFPLPEPPGVDTATSPIFLQPRILLHRPLLTLYHQIPRPRNAATTRFPGPPLLSPSPRSLASLRTLRPSRNLN
jgi:hypothetical protein